ncbi:recombinase family protein [Thalassoroseus pseudoceratinae]|uniref:recombinase family protein n=1 Tax=Thalassoroseus pseudoceratinae TaxID=2713176 RepID=UPI0014230601|nr:recombinase family protein [Thalassoroseus pseudoceratinae]
MHYTIIPVLGGSDDGRILHVAAVCRISTENQDERSLDDQEALLRTVVEQNFDGKVEWTVLRSQGSGESLERQELYELEELIEQRQVELVIAEDLARLCRRRRAYDFCELCEDHNVRLITINDRIDTGREGWQDSAFISTWHHERSNRDTSGRIVRSLRNRFQQGGVFQIPIYGYIKPPHSSRDADIQKDPEAEVIYEQWFQKLEDGSSFSEIADWLNGQQIPVGPGSKTDRWTCSMVGRVTRNPILKGLRVRNARMSKRINKTGRRKAVKAPPEHRLERQCPHLAFIEAERYDRVIRMLAKRNAKYRRHDENGNDKRRDVPRKRTRFPGQMIACGICGYQYVFGGHGQTDHLMCDGARDYRCWNGVSVDGPLATHKILNAVFEAIDRLPDFDDVFCRTINEEAVRIDEATTREKHDCEQNLKRIQRELDRVIEFIRTTESSSHRLCEELSRLESESNRFRDELSRLQSRPSSTIEVPPVDQLKVMMGALVADVAENSYELQKIMRRLIPRIVVFPYRLCDGGRVVLRASFRLRLSQLIPDERTRNTLDRPLERLLTVDLFDLPQREKYRPEVVQKRIPDRNGRRQLFREIGLDLKITGTAAQRAAELQKKMDELGLEDPYLPVCEPPADCKKLCRHRHPRYSFAPLATAGEI